MGLSRIPISRVEIGSEKNWQRKWRVRGIAFKSKSPHVSDIIHCHAAERFANAEQVTFR